MSKLSIITIGTATLDVFLVGEAFRRHRDGKTKGFVQEFPVGSKLEIDDVMYSTGGGASNAAVTFRRLGCKVSVRAKIGDDLAGHNIMKALAHEGIDTNHLKCDIHGKSGYATVLLAPGGERTVLVYRGVSETVDIGDLGLKTATADGLYMSSLAGNLRLLKDITVLAQQRSWRVAYNPGSRELAQAPKLLPLLKTVNLLSLNKDEAQKLFGDKEPAQLLAAAAKYCTYVLITNGSSGAWATDGTQLYHLGLYKDVKVVDRTGAGDAFGSGFAACLFMGKSVEEALSFASANATSVVQQIGAKAGILHDKAKTKPMKIQVTKLTKA